MTQKALYIIDFSKVNHYIEMHQVIKDALDFPEHYGNNWDAFWDSLRDMIGMNVHIILVGWEVIEKKFKQDATILLQILKEFKHYQNDRYTDKIQIELIQEKKRFMIS